MHDNDEGYVPEPEHVELVMDGFLDTVNGTEGLQPTHSQRYLQGALYAAGEIRSIGDVTGNEGFFSAIGDGAKKAWDYIVKMFKSIWDFFFKKDLKEKETKVDEAIQKVEDSIKTVDSSGRKVIKLKSGWTLTEVKKKVDKLPDSPEKKAIEVKIEAAVDKPKETQADLWEGMLPEVFKAALVDNAKIKNAHHKILDAVQRLQDKKVELDKHESDGQSAVGLEIKQFLNGLIGLPDASREFKTLADAKAFIDKAKRCKVAMSTTLGGLKGDEREYRAKIDKAQKEINAYTGKKDKQNQELNKTIGALKTDLAVVAGIITITNVIFQALIDISEALEKACFVVL